MKIRSPVGSIRGQRNLAQPDARTTPNISQAMIRRCGDSEVSDMDGLRVLGGPRRLRRRMRGGKPIEGAGSGLIKCNAWIGR